ncbi:MAG: DUF4091 domain-containing protein, partial [Planctomycetes bacterium]|nr:DUF4091 domain-containing protein [Planctomycetota bacterium]
MRLGHDHRLDLFDTALRPGLKRDIDGNVLLDWKHYDAVAEPYLKGSAFDDRLPVGAWPSPVDETWPDPRNYGGTSNPAYAATVQDVVKAVTAHFAELGAQAMVFHWPARGAVSQEQYDIFSRLGSLIKQGDPQAAILSTLSPALPDEAGIKMPDDVLKIANMLAPAVQWSDLAAPVEQAGGPLSGRWFAPGVVPFGPSLGLAADPADPRALAWMTMKYGCKGLLLNEVLNWRGNVFDTVADAQTRLFYPGKAAGAEGILPSVRLKRLRRGLQDLSYLMLLRQHGRDDLAHNMLNSLVRYAGADARGDNYQDARLNGWVQDGRVWEHARAILIEEVENVINPSELSKRQLLQRRLAWDELYRQATTVRVEQVRTNVSLLEDGRFNASVMLDLYNELASPADVQIAVAAAPPGWNFSKHGSRIAQLEPLTSGVIALELRGSEAPSTHSGKFSMPLSIGIDGNEPVTMDAWMPLLVSSPLRKPVVIDGSLDDWPIRTGNSAGDFVLVGRRGRQGNGLAARQTQAFVLHDSDNLYIAFRCFEPNPAGVISLNDNRLRYEQLMLVAEDAVEILLDPGASAKGVEDLHHMVIKPNGVTIMRRGIACQPPLGKVEPWPAAVTVATSHSVDQWTAEIAIPLKSLGEAATQRLWRVNFARFSTQGGESSSWVPNARHFYDPRNLGTMILPPP